MGTWAFIRGGESMAVQKLKSDPCYSSKGWEAKSSDWKQDGLLPTKPSQHLNFFLQPAPVSRPSNYSLLPHANVQTKLQIKVEFG